MLFLTFMKRIVCISAFLLCVTIDAMQRKEHVVLREKNILLEDVELIGKNEFKDLVGKEILWGKGENKKFYVVRLGDKIAHMDAYKVYYNNGNSGIVCEMSQLYKEKKCT